MAFDPVSTPVLVGVWLAVAGVLAFAAMGVDKRRARADGRRIPERRLLVVALVGGLPGVVLGMVLFRHKTRKLGFKLGVAAIAVAYAVVGLWLTGVVSCEMLGLPRIC